LNRSVRHRPAVPLRRAVQGALREIDRLTALFATVLLVELVRENFFCGAALGTFAGERFKTFVALEPGAMLGGCHGSAPFFVWGALWLQSRHFTKVRRGMRADQGGKACRRHYLIRGSLPPPAQSGV
jgi:hypothetical protein